MDGYENEGFETGNILSNEQLSTPEENSTTIALSNRRSMHIVEVYNEDSESDLEIR